MTVAPHIVFVDDYSLAGLGGGEQHLLRLARACRDQGYRVGVVCAPDSGLEAAARVDGLEVWPERTRGNPLAARNRLTRLFQELSPDIVHAHGYYVMLVACTAAKRARVPSVITTVHNMPSAPIDLHPGLRGRLEFTVRSALYRYVSPSVDRYVCVVDTARRELLDIGISAPKVVVIPNGIPDPATAIPKWKDRSVSEILIGSVGRFELLKDYASFVSAAAKVAGQRADARFRLVGEGSLRDSLERQVDKLGLRDRFEFAGWSADPLAEIAAMDIYVVSSVTDTTNLTVLEAMGLGRPVVATDVGGISDAIVDGVDGRLVPRRHPELLAEAILELAADPVMRDAMGAEGRKRFEAMFTEGRMVEAHRLLYRGLLADV